MSSPFILGEPIYKQNLLKSKTCEILQSAVDKILYFANDGLL